MTSYLTPLVEPAEPAPETGETGPLLSEFIDLPGESPGKKRSGRRAKLSPAMVRRVIERYELLTDAHAEHRELLAAALGVEPDVKGLTVHSLTAGASSAASIGALTSIARHESPFEATVTAMSLEREQGRRVWHLLRVLGKVTGPIPGKEAAAGAKIAEAAMSLSADQFEVLTAVERLVA